MTSAQAGSISKALVLGSGVGVTMLLAGANEFPLSTGFPRIPSRRVGLAVLSHQTAIRKLDSPVNQRHSNQPEDVSTVL
jgi:hypothetical protein